LSLMAAVDTFSLSRLHSLFALDAIKVPFQHKGLGFPSRTRSITAADHGS
jgi:hypothetical protein